MAKRLILRDISLHVHSRRGWSPCLAPMAGGKTTCFYCIAGIVKHEGGSVHLNGARCDQIGLPLFRRARGDGAGDYLPQEMRHLSRPEAWRKTSLSVLEIRPLR